MYAAEKEPSIVEVVETDKRAQEKPPITLKSTLAPIVWL